MNTLHSSIISINPGHATSGEVYLAAHALPASEAMPLNVDYAPSSLADAVANPFRTIFATALRIGMRLRGIN